MVYASQEYAKIPYIRKWYMQFVNGIGRICEFDLFVGGPEQIKY
jgi:hypothetical protein